MGFLLLMGLGLAVAGIAAAAAGSSSSSSGGGGIEVEPGVAQLGWSNWRKLVQQIKMDPDKTGGGRLALAVGDVPRVEGTRIELQIEVVLASTDPVMYRCQAWTGVVIRKTGELDAQQSPYAIDWTEVENTTCKPNGVDATQAVINGKVYTAKSPALWIEPSTPLGGDGNVWSWVRSAGNWLARGSSVQRIRVSI